MLLLGSFKGVEFVPFILNYQFNDNIRLKLYTDLAHDAIQILEVHMAFVMKYKGFTGSLAYSKKDSLMVGSVLDTEDTLCYHGKTLQEATSAFKQCVDNYLEMQKSQK